MKTIALLIGLILAAQSAFAETFSVPRAKFSRVVKLTGKLQWVRTEVNPLIYASQENADHFCGAKGFASSKILNVASCYSLQPAVAHLMQGYIESPGEIAFEVTKKGNGKDIHSSGTNFGMQSDDFGYSCLAEVECL